MSEIDILKDQIESLQAALVAKEETHKIDICKLIEIDLNELDNILFAEYVDHQLFIIGKQNEKTTFIRREVTE